MADPSPRTSPDQIAFERRPRRASRPAPPWGGGDVAPDQLGLYRRFTMGAARLGWRLAPQDIEALLDIYLAYIRRMAEPSPERCLRTFRRLQRQRA